MFAPYAYDVNYRSLSSSKSDSVTEHIGASSPDDGNP